MGKIVKESNTLFQSWKGGVLHSQVIAGFSLNVEEVIEGLGIPAPFDVGRSKVTVAEVISPLGDKGFFTVRPLQGELERFWAQRLFRSYAGSSANIESVLRQLQRNLPADRSQRASIVAAVGRGAQARSLVSELDEAGVQYALMPAEGTNVTLNLKVRSRAQQVMLCEKKRWLPPAGLVDLLRKAGPHVVVFTGVREQELAVVRDIFAAYRKKRAFRALGLHLDLLTSDRRDLKEHVRATIRDVELLALSQDEALALVADTHLFDEHLFDPTNEDDVRKLVQAVAALGAKINSVTFAEHGAVVMAGDTIIRRQGLRPPKAVRDTAGAGDAFLAALIYYYVLKKNHRDNKHVNISVLQRAIDRAQVVAVHKICHLGSASGIPSEDEVEKFLRKKGR